MAKIIKRPLTDMYGRDFTTGKIMKSEPIKQEKWLHNFPLIFLWKIIIYEI